MLFKLSEFIIPHPPIQVICPSSQKLPDVLERINIILEEGIRWIQYRGKDSHRRTQFKDCLEIKKLCSLYNAIFIVNDYPDIAILVDADGVHIGQDDLPVEMVKRAFPLKIIGLSTHNLEEALVAEKTGITYIGFGPIFSTTTKDAGKPKGPSAIKEIKRNIKLPIVAIGGIKAENLISVFENGADAIAVSSGIIEGDVKKNVRSFLKTLEELRRYGHD